MPTPKQNPSQAARRGATPSNARNKSAGAATAKGQRPMGANASVSKAPADSTRSGAQR